MTYPYYAIKPSMGFCMGKNIYIPRGHRVMAREFYLSEKNKILEDCIKNPTRYLEG